MKNARRVRDLGEVFTPVEMVESMLDLLPDDVWRPETTFFEPAAGHGNFLVVILARKLDALSAMHNDGELPAGEDTEALIFHGLQALSSIYAVDISKENIEGTDGEPHTGARSRMLALFRNWLQEISDQQLTSSSDVMASADWILERNVLVANMLRVDANGRPTNRDQLPLVEYRWQPDDLQVEVVATTLGEVQSQARLNGAGQVTLFDRDEEPTVAWSGPAHDLRDAPIAAPSGFDGPVRNGKKVG